MTQSSESAVAKHETAFRVLGAISVSHFLNDMMQSLILAMYPLIKGGFNLSFAQIGLITFTFQATASLLQPLVGMYTDRHPKPYSLVFGMGCTLTGLLLLAMATSYPGLLCAAALVGSGSSIFHPESSRVARMASGGRFGLAQSLFQVGGNAGTALGPLLTALIVIPNGQGSVAWFALAAVLAMAVLWKVGNWYAHQQAQGTFKSKLNQGVKPDALPRGQVVAAITILLTLIFSKYFYLASLSSYFTFYLMHKFGISVQAAQIQLFVFLFAVAAGTIIGGPVGDRIGRKRVIWFSILGVAPFTMMLPHANLFWTGILSFIIGLILASAFSAIIVFAQELMPGRVGMVAGLFFGFSFGMGAIGAALLGKLADWYGIEFVYQVCAYLPLLGLLTAFLPDVGRKKA
ncbi:MFS transporter, FSR family, fosmidomycin resistance protein [Formivibrio citricus]|uniref:MFS transporter, FSR family, fosmidomycin resistance protein n=1 Tax=Formivibrio citricus TaxID=83765 RepID=A0A1I5ARY7_9NEIS|nr:MFS transporter [Formivibrio citricus]SFN65211.1 MFS transporter, FSR family, fosmidomycin resistance protein [Formivibrio citricus]